MDAIESNERIKKIIDNFKAEIKEDSELKKYQLKLIQILSLGMILLEIAILVLIPIIYIYYIDKYNLKESQYHDSFYLLYYSLITIGFFACLALKIRELSVKYKCNRIIKERIKKQLLNRINYDINWEVDIEMFDLDNLTKKYKEALFNKIDSDNSNVLHTSKNQLKLLFLSYLFGNYKSNYKFEILDFTEYYRITYKKNRRIILNKGIFGVSKLDTNTNNEIRITNNKMGVFLEKHYMIKSLPDSFNNSFVLLAKDGYKIQEKLSEKLISILDNYYNLTKIKFDISIRNDELFFRFKTSEFINSKLFGDVVDYKAVENYANTINFIAYFLEEINMCWE